MHNASLETLVRDALRRTAGCIVALGEDRFKRMNAA
jgi:hypothetical protein